MVKFFSRDIVFDHPWSTVVSAFWQKFPNPESPVVQVDTFKRSFNAETGELTTYRLIAAQPPIPRWLPTLGVPTTMYSIERCTINRDTNTMRLETRNISASSILTVEEDCRYTPAGDQTGYTQTARITGRVTGFCGMIENYSFQSILNAGKNHFARIDMLCESARARARDAARDALDSVDAFAAETQKSFDSAVDSAVGSAKHVRQVVADTYDSMSDSMSEAVKCQSHSCSSSSESSLSGECDDHRRDDHSDF